MRDYCINRPFGACRPGDAAQRQLWAAAREQCTARCNSVSACRTMQCISYVTACNDLRLYINQFNIIYSNVHVLARYAYNFFTVLFSVLDAAMEQFLIRVTQ